MGKHNQIGALAEHDVQAGPVQKVLPTLGSIADVED